MKTVYDIAQILKYHPEGLILTCLVDKLHPTLKNNPSLKKKYHAKYVQISRIIENNPELFSKSKIGNLANIKLTEAAFDLLRAGVKFKQNVKTPESLRSYPKRCRSQRIEAVKIIDSVKTLTKEERADIKSEFHDYLDEVKEFKIVLRRKDIISDDIYTNIPKFKILPYVTRFIAKEIAAKNLDKMDAAFAYMTQRYKKGVHLTLTTDPNRFYSLYAANRHFSKAFNRYMSFLSRKHGKRLPYIAAYEYTKSGLLHAHVLLFGISWLAHKHAITEDWNRCGQGRITYIYTIINNNGRWTYSRNKPHNLAKGKTAADYLKKYLKKSIYDTEEAMLYWALNKRFFSCTRAALSASTDQPKLYPTYPIWEFFMTATYFTMPDFIFEQVVLPP